MDCYQYPKDKHVRNYQFKSKFKNYSTYKGYLRREFRNLCIYCRTPDTLTVNVYYTVEHFKPKSKFSGLECEYTNLFYCCPACNSRKNDYWPVNVGDPNFENPCDARMADHLRFDISSAKVSERSKNGKFMIDVLELNDPVFVDHRQLELTTVKMALGNLDKRKKFDAGLDKAYAEGRLDQVVYAQKKEKNREQMELLERVLAKHTGAVVPPPLSVRQSSYLV